jgi:hypothetical protein
MAFPRDQQTFFRPKLSKSRGGERRSPAIFTVPLAQTPYRSAGIPGAAWEECKGLDPFISSMLTITHGDELNLTR